MNTKLKYIVTAILVLLIVLFFYNKYRVAPSVDFTKLILTDLSGKPVRYEDFKGKKVIFSFGASWCGNCLIELRDLMAIKESELKDVEVVIISDEPLQNVIAFKERNNYPFTFLKMIGSFNSIGVNAIPTNYIVNENLEIKYEKVGEIDWNDPSTLQHMKKLME